MTDNERELYELAIALQAEISALKQMMFEANPNLSAVHQAKANQLRNQLLRDWEQNRRDDPRDA